MLLNTLLCSLILSPTPPSSRRQAIESKVLTCSRGNGGCDFYEKQWSFKNNLSVNPWGVPIASPKDIRIEPVWERGIQGSSDIVIAVIDSGLDITHPDLAGNIFVNTREIPANGQDDDENGYIDDVNGWNFVLQSPDVSDPIGHGTHIAGIIGARGDNDFGVKGINWRTQILPVVYLDKEGNGNLQNSIDAVRYAVKSGAKIINASWGGYTADALRETIEWAATQGVLFITTSGNDGENLDMYPYYPASFQLDNMIVVGSSEFSDNITGDSNWGKNTVDILAPGIEIISTLPGQKYGYMSGTSMAAPHVAGAAALLWSEHPEWSYREIKSALLTRSIIHPKFENRVRYGRLDLLSLFEETETVKWFPTIWTFASNQSVLQYEKRGIYSTRLSSPGSRAVRVRFSQLNLKEGSQRVVIKDSNGVPVQRLTSHKGHFTSDYVFGSGLELEVLLDKDGAFQAEIEGLERAE